eukprot:1853840-Rhodomonas_salina.3
MLLLRDAMWYQPTTCCYYATRYYLGYAATASCDMSGTDGGYAATAGGECGPSDSPHEAPRRAARAPQVRCQLNRFRLLSSTTRTSNAFDPAREIKCRSLLPSTTRTNSVFDFARLAMPGTGILAACATYLELAYAATRRLTAIIRGCYAVSGTDLG